LAWFAYERADAAASGSQPSCKVASGKTRRAGNEDPRSRADP
jgi:hypothetical protein